MYLMNATGFMGKISSDTNKPIRKVGETMFDEKSEVVSEKQKLFIRRERIRRELIKTRKGETICLTFEQVDTLLKWMKELENKIKELEERIKKYGIKVN